jgi:DNA invertase Pin-like site-specific DNA recombinase
MTKATHRVAIYLRVSTLDQTTANQDGSSARLTSSSFCLRFMR